MRVVLSGYFDAGFGIGIDNQPFDEIRKESLVNPEGFAQESERMKSPFFQDCPYNTKLGRGLYFDITESPEFKEWQEDAHITRFSEDFRNEYCISPGGKEKLSHFPVSQVNYTVMLTLYSCGIGCLEIIFDNLPEKSFDAETSARFIQTFEVASYGLYGSMGNFQKKLQAKCQTILNHFTDSKNTDARQCMSRMPEKKEDRFSYDFFPSFTILFFPQHIENAASIRKFFETTQTEFTTVSLDGTAVNCSWYIFIEPLERPDNSRTLCWIIRTYNLFYGICQAHSISLTARISGLFFNISQADKGDLDNLIKLRITSCVFTNYTHLSDFCQNEEILKIWNVLNQGEKLSMFHQSMQNNVDILNSIQNQIDQTNDKLKEEHCKKQESRLNKFVAIITTLTFISVITDFFSLDDRSSLYIPSIFMRFIIYAFALATLLFCLFHFFREEKRNDS